MRASDSGVEPDVISYNATISACEKGMQWEKALALFYEMKGVGLVPTVISYNSVISALGKGRQWEKALEIFDKALELDVHDGSKRHVQIQKERDLALTQLKDKQTAEQEKQRELATEAKVDDLAKLAQQKMDRCEFAEAASLFGRAHALAPKKKKLLKKQQQKLLKIINL